jgi:hypothetical protein
VFVRAASTASSAHTLRSARRATVRAWCSSAASGVPPGSTKDVSGDSSAFAASQAASSRSVYSAVIRRGGWAGWSVIGVDRSAPTSNRSFWTLRSSAATSGEGAPSATARPSTLLVSSTSA